MLMVFAVLLGGAKCEEGQTHPSAPRVPEVPQQQPAQPENPVPAPREGDPQPHPKRIVTIRAQVPERKFWPWEIFIVAPGSDKPYVHEVVSQHNYNTRLLVEADAKTKIVVRMLLPGAGSQLAYCAIESGNQHDGPRFSGGLHTWNCFLELK